MTKRFFILLFTVLALLSCNKEVQEYDFYGWERDLEDFQFLFDLCEGDTLFYAKGDLIAPVTITKSTIELKKDRDINSRTYGSEKRIISADMETIIGLLNLQVVVTDPDAINFTKTVDLGEVKLEVFLKAYNSMIELNFYGKENLSRSSLFKFKSMIIKQVGDEENNGVYTAGVGIESFVFLGDEWHLERVGRLNEN